MTISGQAHLPNKRPRTVTLIGCLFVASGIIGLAHHASAFNTQGLFEGGEAWVLSIRILAIVGGVFMLRGANWARWLALVWIAYHVILSALHSLSETVIHIVLLAGFAYVLLRPQASAYFRSTRRRPEQPAA